MKNQASRWRRILLLSGVSLVLMSAACGGGGGGGGATPPPPPPPTSNPVPAITSLSPASVAVGAAAQNLTIQGSGFLPASTVAWNGSNRAATYVSSTQLTVPLAATDLATAGTDTVVVTNPAPGGGASNSVNFTVSRSPAPVITALSPASATAGASAQALDIQGSGFVAASTVTWNGASHPATFVSATEITVALTSADLATAGSYSVAVTNPSLDGGVSNSLSFTVSNPVPAIASLAPASAAAGAAAQTLTLQGSGFVAASSVTYNGVAHAASFVGPTELTIALSASDQASAGSYPVVVTNPAPGGGASGSASFAVNNLAPTLTSITPATIAVGAPATTVTLQGTNFSAATQVLLNGSALASQASGPDQLTVSLPASDMAAAGSLGLSVSNPAPGGGSSPSTSVAVVAVASLALVATPVGGGSAAGPWQLAVAASTPQGAPVAGLAVTLQATAGTLSAAQGTTDAGGGFSATITPPSGSSGAAIAVGATTGAQTAAVNLVFAAPSGSQSLAMRLRAAASPASGSAPQTAPFTAGFSAAAGASNPYLANPSVCTSDEIAYDSADTVNASSCASTYQADNASPALVNAANTVCTEAAQAVGTAACSGAAAVSTSCLVAQGSGPLLCAGVMALPAASSSGSGTSPCVTSVGEAMVEHVGGLSASATLGNFVDAAGLAAGPPLAGGVVGFACNSMDTASTLASVTGSGGLALTLAPGAAVATPGSTVALTATGTGAAGGLTWALDGIAGASGGLGSISATGVYTAPTTLPVPNVVTVSATSQADPTATAQVVVNLAVNAGNASGAPSVMAASVDGVLADVAYVPVAANHAVAVVNLDAATDAQGISTSALVATIAMPAGFAPTATASDQTTQQVVVISSFSQQLVLIDGTSHQITGTYTVPASTPVNFSGGSCYVCGVTMDPTTGSAILDTAAGYMQFSLSAHTFSSPIGGSIAGENFGYDANRKLIVGPYYNHASAYGLQAIDLQSGSVHTYTGQVGTEPDAAAVDLATGIAVVPDEFTSNEYLINLANPQFSGSGFSAPEAVMPLSFTDCEESGDNDENEWTMLSLDSGSHALFLGTEFSDCAAVQTLPSATPAGAPPASTPFQWGHVPSPDSTAWNDGGDPHGVSTFTSVVDGKSYGFVIRKDQLWVAKIDLQAVAAAPALAGGLQGEVNLASFVTFYKAQ